MTIIYLTADQSADQNLIQALCRSVSDLAKRGSVLILREASQHKEIDRNRTLVQAKYLTSQLNESGVAVVSAEGIDRGLFKFDEKDDFVLGKIDWLLSLLRQRVVLSISLYGENTSGNLFSVSLGRFIDELRFPEENTKKLVFLHPKGKARVEADGVQKADLELNEFAHGLPPSASNLKKSIAELQAIEIKITNTIGLLSENIERATRLIH